MDCWPRPASVRADAIDGDWCHADGRRLSIHGPDLVTPGGRQIVGDYDRHGFVYVVPQGESGAGDKVVMTLLSETRMQSRQGGDEAPVQVLEPLPADSQRITNSCAAVMNGGRPPADARELATRSL